jgi:Tol biopolymer transport system component
MFKRQNRCDKKTGAGCGAEEIWIMNADGSGQAPVCDPGDYQWARKRDQTSPDGTWYLDVARNQGNDIRRVYQDGRKEFIIVNNLSDWDPALSADGWWLAWVTNRNGNDEIYIKTIDWTDQNQRRLTENAWEWDKHPTWSPDGHKIAFYSNRADKLSEATRQIWVMEVVGDRGINLKNLSKNPDKVDTDPVWIKWEIP